MAVKTQEYKKGVPAKYLEGLPEEEAAKRAAEIKSTGKTVREAYKEGRDLPDSFYKRIDKLRREAKD